MAVLQNLLINTVFPLISASGTYLMSKFSVAVYIKGQRLKEGGAYFKKRRVILIKSENFVIVFFKITLNNNHYDMESYIFQRD